MNELNTSEAAVVLLIAKLQTAGVDDGEIAGALLAAGAVMARDYLDPPHAALLIANYAREVATNG